MIKDEKIKELTKEITELNTSITHHLLFHQVGREDHHFLLCPVHMRENSVLFSEHGVKDIQCIIYWVF